MIWIRNLHLTICSIYKSIVHAEITWKGRKRIQIYWILTWRSYSGKEISWNYLLFVLEGECIINCNQFRERLFQANCMVLLPKTAMVEIKVIAGTRLLSLSFDVPLNVCDKFILQSLTGLCRKLDYNFQSLAIRYPLPPYLEIVTYCLTNKMDCGHFHTLLQQELFFYSGVFIWKKN